jgi:hypothetical protein
MICVPVLALVHARRCWLGARGWLDGGGYAFGSSARRPEVRPSSGQVGERRTWRQWHSLGRRRAEEVEAR